MCRGGRGRIRAFCFIWRDIHSRSDKAIHPPLPHSATDNKIADKNLHTISRCLTMPPVSDGRVPHPFAASITSAALNAYPRRSCWNVIFNVYRSATYQSENVKFHSNKSSIYLRKVKFYNYYNRIRLVNNFDGSFLRGRRFEILKLRKLLDPGSIFNQIAI